MTTVLTKSLSRVLVKRQLKVAPLPSQRRHFQSLLLAGQVRDAIGATEHFTRENKVSTFCTQQQQQQQQQASRKRFFGTSSQLEKGLEETGTSSSSSSSSSSGGLVLLSKPQKHVASIELNNPRTKNAFALETADELVRIFDELEGDSSTRCVLLSGSGADLTSGVDIKSFMSVYAQLQDGTQDVAHRAHLLKRVIERFQAPFKRMHNFSKPIICVQHGLSLGLGMELAACSEVRYCSRDTKMAIREVLIGIAADVGSLQLMPRLSANQSLLAELIYSGRYITTEEALQELKFVSRVFETKESALEGALKLATSIARRSPVAVQGSKRNLRFSSEHSFGTGLDYNAVWNAAMMQGGDVITAISAILGKQVDEVEYEDL